MKKTAYLFFIAFITLTACRKIVVDDTSSNPPPVTPPATGGQTILSGKITGDTTLKAANTYILDGLVYIKTMRL
jgi:hypothetical protein